MGAFDNACIDAGVALGNAAARPSPDTFAAARNAVRNVGTLAAVVMPRRPRHGAWARRTLRTAPAVYVTAHAIDGDAAAVVTWAEHAALTAP